MAKYNAFGGETSRKIDVFIQDSSASVVAGLSGLVFNTAGLVAFYKRSGDTVWTAITLVTATLGTWVSGGFVTSGRAGWYELSLPNAILNTGTTHVNIELSGAANMQLTPIEIQVDAVNYHSTTSFLTGVNGLTPPTRWNQMLIGTDGVTQVNMAQILATALTEDVAGYLTAGFKKLFNVAAPLLTAASINQSGDNFVRLGTPEGASIAADLLRLLGLNGHNQGIRNTLMSGDNLVSYDLCLYDTAPHATTNDGVTGLIGKYSISRTYDSNAHPVNLSSPKGS